MTQSRKPIKPTDHTKTGGAKTAATKTADAKTADAKTADAKTADQSHKPAEHIEETARLASSVEKSKDPGKVQRARD